MRSLGTAQGGAHRALGGAIIALLAASAAPRYFGRVVLLTPSPCHVNEPGYYGGFECENLQQVLESMQADYHRWAYQFADLIMGDANSPVLSEELGQYFIQAYVAINQNFVRVIFSPTAGPACSGCTCPRW